MIWAVGRDLLRWRDLRRRVGAYAERRLVLASPSRRQRFALALETVRHLSNRPRLSVLDAGCGDGLLAEAAAQRNPAWQVLGVDSSPAALARAAARSEAAGLRNIRFHEADLTQGLGESLYDVIFAVECLEEIEEDRRALQMLAAALAPGGLLLVHVPERGWTPTLRGSSNIWRHEVRHGYDRAELVRLIEETGLTVVEVRGSYRRLVQLAQEIRDRIKTAPTWRRALAFPLMVLAVWLETAGLTWGREQALFAVARRRSDPTTPYSELRTQGDEAADDSMAYVAVLSTDSFLEGVLVLNESLRLCRSKHKLVVVVSGNVSSAVREILDRANVPQIHPEQLAIPDYILAANEKSDFHRHWSYVFDKLHAFSLTQFEKIVYVDSDVLVLRNIDDLFDKPHMSATVAGELPGRDASVDFSTGLMVIEPEPGLTGELVSLLPEAFERERRWRTAAGRPMSMGVQGVINLAWPDWMARSEVQLHPKYNVMATHLDYYLAQLDYRLRGPDAIRVLHFDGEVKPWMTTGIDFYRRVGGLVVRRRSWEAAAFLGYKAILQSARLRLTRAR
jgi:trans-aconitate methyltransferase/alpha-N-acetylglucosamine transferase